MVVFVVGLDIIFLVVERVLGGLVEDVVVTVSVELCCLQLGESWQGPLESVFPFSSTAVAHQRLPRW